MIRQGTNTSLEKGGESKCNDNCNNRTGMNEIDLKAGGMEKHTCDDYCYRFVLFTFMGGTRRV